MKKNRSILFFLIIFSFISRYALPAVNPDIPEGITLAIRAGNAAELAKYFNRTIELVILEKENVYSNQQAEQIIKNFFIDHRPSSFKIIFEGGKETSRYAIGSLDTSNGKFRVYFLIKEQDGAPLIHQLRIEKDDESEL